ncbi:RRM domain-containing protein [Nephila pilipes]|uniref:RRM domain-containing protein n=1 Tax=Nephila pilipes TaxID=299642 RepID=A0A8X6N6D5_NEPPI|nr:RRM domain-containing protein [Nephila pilipes]
MPVQKTPHNKRPKGKQSMSERKVSFELPGKKTPARTPQKNNSLFAKKQLTPAGKGRTAVQKFKGNKALQDNDIEDDDDSEVDIDDISEDEDDSDDMDDIGMDDDDSDDMDEDDGEEEQKQIQKPKKSNANQQKNMNTIKKTPVKDAENLKGLQSPKEKGLENEKRVATTINAKSLVVGNLPEDMTTDELKALSPDIVKVTKKIGYAYLLFASEDKVDTNYEALKGKELRGRSINIDYVGEKSKFTGYDAKSLFVGNLPEDVTTEELKALSPDIVKVTKCRSGTEVSSLRSLVGVNISRCGVFQPARFSRDDISFVRRDCSSISSSVSRNSSVDSPPAHSARRTPMPFAVE